MKKSALKPDLKLKLNRETLRILAPPQLGGIFGGGETDDPSVTIRYSNCGSCNTGGGSGVQTC